MKKYRVQSIQYKAFFLFIFVLSSFIIYHLSFSIVRATLDCLNPDSITSNSDRDYCISEIDRLKNLYLPAQENNKKNLASLQSQLSNLTKRIDVMASQLATFSKNITKRQESLAYTQELFNEKTREQYAFMRLYDPITPFIFSDSATDAFRQINLRQTAADSDRKTIGEYAKDLEQLKKDQEALKKNKESLANLQKQVSVQTNFLASEVGKVDSFLTVLSNKQQEILAAKAGSFITSVGDVELADDYNASIKGFRESAPSGSFAVFSFGAYTHRKGMSQYGARGRAENGQGVNQILKAYYGRDPVNKDTGGSISVAGIGNVNFEDYYLMGIAEMPSTWHPEALKAQAIAARTYAYRYKVEGKQICTTETCQVFRKSKADNPPEAWKKAVQDTRGKILENVVTFYSSTAGGYSFSSAWDTTDGSGGGNFIDKAWESKGGSPWLYKSWYRQGYTASGATCGKSNPWLTNSELTDLVNAALALKKPEVDKGRITPTSCFGGNAYSSDELRNVAGGISSVSSVSVLQGNGVTNEVIINGNIKLTGLEFKKGFNLRAPGYLRIPQGVDFGSSVDFAFFNIEKK
jgi:peptidoglycan hydrolase CwlO-like protein